MLRVLCLTVLSLITISVRADEPNKDTPREVKLVNKSKDIFIVSDRDEPILDCFRRQHIIVGGVALEGFKKVREAKVPVSKFFINYASQNDDKNLASTFGATIDIAPPSESIAKLLGEHAPDGKDKLSLTLILRPDEKKAGLYHVIGCTERTSVGFFDRDKKDPTDGFSQKDLCFAARPGFVREEFVNEEEVFKYLGTSSVVESGSNLLVAWSGAIEGRINTGIWMSQLTNDKWGQPTKIAEAGPRDDEDRLCRHPALVQPAKGPLMLFYDWHPSKWLILAKKYDDSEKKWTDEAKIGHWEGNIKGRPIQLGDGALLVPTHTAGGKLRFERTSDGGKTWADQVLAGDAKTIAAIQPCVFRTGKDKLQALAQTKQDRICQTFSEDDGKTWSKLSYTTLPSPNTGIDAIALADGRFLVVYNHASSGTSPLNVAVSSDGKDWKAALVLEQGAGEFVEPSVIQTSDGLVHVTYTWNQKKVKHVVLDPKKLELHEMKEGKWPE